jgi:hypothetical protein
MLAPTCNFRSIVQISASGSLRTARITAGERVTTVNALHMTLLSHFVRFDRSHDSLCTLAAQKWFSVAPFSASSYISSNTNIPLLPSKSPASPTFERSGNHD